jgi:hypothetical protein
MISLCRIAGGNKITRMDKLGKKQVGNKDDDLEDDISSHRSVFRDIGKKRKFFSRKMF